MDPADYAAPPLLFLTDKVCTVSNIFVINITVCFLSGWVVVVFEGVCDFKLNALANETMCCQSVSLCVVFAPCDLGW